MSRSCIRCKEPLPGYRSTRYCTDCWREMTQGVPKGHRRCSKCKQVFPTDALVIEVGSANYCHPCFETRNIREWVRLLVYSTNQRARYAGAPGTVTIEEVLTLLDATDWTCVYCGKPDGDARPSRISLDHVVPLCAGGENVITNIVPACVGCNIKKNQADAGRFVHVYHIAGFDWQRQQLRALFEPAQP